MAAFQSDQDVDFSKEQLSLHPQALRPNFLWTAQLPLNWAFLDTNPATWKRNAEKIINDYFVGSRLKRSEHSALMAYLEKAIKASQENKILLSFILPGPLESGEFGACTLLVRWQSFSPDVASMGTVEHAFGKREGKEQRTTNAGSPYLLFGGEVQIGPITDRKSAWNYQAVMPVLSTPWTVIVSGMAPTAEMGGMIRDIVVRLANNIQCYPQQTGLILDPELNQAGDLVANESEVVAAMATA